MFISTIKSNFLFTLEWWPYWGWNNCLDLVLGPTTENWKGMKKNGVLFYQCTHCPHVTKSNSNIKKHFNDRHNPNPTMYHCPFCRISSKQKENLKIHIGIKHANQWNNIEGGLKSVLDSITRSWFSISAHKYIILYIQGNYNFITTRNYYKSSTW